MKGFSVLFYVAADYGLWVRKAEEIYQALFLEQSHKVIGRCRIKKFCVLSLFLNPALSVLVIGFPQRDVRIERSFFQFLIFTE